MKEILYGAKKMSYFGKIFESFMNMVICTIDEIKLYIYTKGAIKIEK